MFQIFVTACSEEPGPCKNAVYHFTARTMLSSVPVAVLEQWAVCDTDENLLYGEIDFVLQAFQILFC